jgi:hypothetical protein
LYVALSYTLLLPLFLPADETSHFTKQHLSPVHSLLGDVLTMRFGRELPWHQVPKWASYYIHYDEWKFLVKTGKFEGMFAPACACRICALLTMRSKNSKRL